MATLGTRWRRGHGHGCTSSSGRGIRSCIGGCAGCKRFANKKLHRCTNRSALEANDVQKVGKTKCLDNVSFNNVLYMHKKRTKYNNIAKQQQHYELGLDVLLDYVTQVCIMFQACRHECVSRVMSDPQPLPGTLPRPSVLPAQQAAWPP